MTPLTAVDAPYADVTLPIRRLARRVLGLAWPVLALQLLVMTVDLSDRFLVGHVPGAGPEVAQSMLAAQGTAHYIAWFIGSYTVLVTVGATAVVAWSVGAGEYRTAARATHQALILGVLLGTAISYMLAAIAVTAVLARGRAGLQIRLSGFRPDAALMRRILRVSIPAGIDSLSIVGGQLWFLHIVNTLGDTAAAAHGIAIGWEASGYLSGYAFGTAAMTLVGQYLGARQPRWANRAGWTAFALASGFMSVMGAVFYAFAPGMFWLFCQDPGQAPVIEAGVPALRLIAFAMPALASTMILTAALRGAGG